MKRALISSLLLFSAQVSCSSSGDEPMDAYDCALDTRDDDYVAGIEKTGAEGFRFQIVDAIPAPPDRGDNNWTIEIIDKNGMSVKKCFTEHCAIYARS